MEIMETFNRKKKQNVQNKTVFLRGDERITKDKSLYIYINIPRHIH